MATAHINRIGTAVPPHDVHEAVRALRRRFHDRTPRPDDLQAHGQPVGHRAALSYFEPVTDPDGFVADTEGFYTPGNFPGTAARMARFEKTGPQLAMQALDALNPTASASASRIWWWHPALAISRAGD